MRRRIAGTLTLLAIASVLAPSAQAAIDARWQAETGEIVHDTAFAPDGSIYVVGERLAKISRAGFLAKYSAGGDLLWSKAWLPDPHASTTGVAVDVAPDGRVVWVGHVYGQCEGNGWFMQVHRPSGVRLHRYVTPGWACEIAQNVSDVEVIAGRPQIVVSGYGHGCCGDPEQDGWVRGFTMGALPQWTAQFEPPAGVSPSYSDRATSVASAGGWVYVVGWAATVPRDGETLRPAGMVVLQKMTLSGDVTWRKGAFRGRYGNESTAVADARRGRVTIAVSSRVGTIGWGMNPPPEAWLGAFTTDGDRLWTRTWGTEWRFAADPTGVSIDAAGHTWVVGTRRDPGDRGLDVFVRRFSPAGVLADRSLIDGPERWLVGTGVDTLGVRGSVAGAATNRFNESTSGRVWVVGVV